MTRASAPVGSRTARAKADKQARIFAAAAELFQQRGYEAVTTQMIADAADVGAGTVFLRYPTKASLFVAVMREHLAAGIDTARRLAADGATALDAILALTEPMLAMTEQHPHNAAVFQREVLFGAGNTRRDGNDGAVDDQHDDLLEPEHAIGDILASTHPHLDEERRADTAHAIYATVYLDLVRASRMPTATPVRNIIPRHVAMLLEGISSPHPRRQR